MKTPLERLPDIPARKSNVDKALAFFLYLCLFSIISAFMLFATYQATYYGKKMMELF